MIVRLMGEGQFRIDDALTADLNEIDSSIDLAIERGSDESLAAALGAMAALVRERGAPLADDELVPSDAILPPPGISLDELLQLAGAEGLIPG
ncbi:MAG: hypothetical protein AB7H85_16805 [Dehalococcoidia bacterium]